MIVEKPLVVPQIADHSVLVLLEIVLLHLFVLVSLRLSEAGEGGRCDGSSTRRD